MAISAKVSTTPQVKVSVQNNSVSKTVGVQNSSKVKDRFSIDASEISVSLDNSTATNVRDALNGTSTTGATQTYTNKTINADNNTISNLEVDNIKAATLVVESEGISSNDNDTTLPTSAAVKDYVDNSVTGEDTLAEMNDTNLTSPANGALLRYDSSSSKWIDDNDINGGTFV